VKTFISADSESVLSSKVKLTEELLGGGDIIFHPIDFEKGVPDSDFDPKGGFGLSKERVIRGIEFREGVGVFECEGLIAHGLS
jgi:hypothetical protein